MFVQCSERMHVSENRGTPKSIHFKRVFHYVHHPFWGVSLYLETPISGSKFQKRLIYPPWNEKQQVTSPPKNAEQSARKSPKLPGGFGPPSSGAMFVSFREDIPRMEGFLVGSSAFTSEVMDNGHQCFPRQEPFHENPKTLHHSEALSIFLKIFVKSLRAFPRVIYPQKLTWQWNKLWKKHHHMSRCISYWKWGDFPASHVRFQGG